MDKFKYYLDSGTGYQEVDIYNNGLVISNGESDFSPAAVRIELSGTFDLLGSAFDLIDNYSGNYMPFMIEQLKISDGLWYTIFDGVIDTRVQMNYNERKLTIKEIRSSADNYDNFIANLGVVIGFYKTGIDTFFIQTPPTLSQTINVISIQTHLSNFIYKTLFDVDGRALNTGELDVRWDYFLFKSTSGVSPNLIHTYESMSYDYPPWGSAGYTKIELIISGEKIPKWAKLPPSVGVSESNQTVIAAGSLRLDQLISELCIIVSSSVITFDPDDITYTGIYSYAPFDMKKLHLCENSLIANQETVGSGMTLEYIFDILEKGFNLFWYLDGTELKFKHATELSQVGEVDLFSETANKKRYEYILSDMPDVETFITGDSQGDQDTASTLFTNYQIMYSPFRSDFYRATSIENIINFSSNIEYIHSGRANTSQNQYALIECTDSTSSQSKTIYVSGKQNSRLGFPLLFAHLNKYRYGDSAELANDLKYLFEPLSDIESRPLKRIPIVETSIDLFTDFDINRKALTSMGDAKIVKISQQLSGDKLLIDMLII